MGSVVFTQSLMETIPSSELEKGNAMEENVMNETTIDEETYDDFIEEQTEAGDGVGLKIIGAGIAATGVVAGLAWKKFGPAIKAKASDLKKRHLEKVNEKLAKKQVKVQAKLTQMQPASEAEKKEE